MYYMVLFSLQYITIDTEVNRHIIISKEMIYTAFSSFSYNSNRFSYFTVYVLYIEIPGQARIYF